MSFSYPFNFFCPLHYTTKNQPSSPQPTQQFSHYIWRNTLCVHRQSVRILKAILNTGTTGGLSIASALGPPLVEMEALAATSDVPTYGVTVVTVRAVLAIGSEDGGDGGGGEWLGAAAVLAVLHPTAVLFLFNSRIKSTPSYLRTRRTKKEALSRHLAG